MKKVLAVNRQDIYTEYENTKVKGKSLDEWEKERYVTGTREGITTLQKEEVKINIYNKYTDKLLGTTTESKWIEDFDALIEKEC